MDDACPGKASATPPSVPTCQVCGEPLAGRAVVQCSTCATPHHLECWRFNKGCSMYGCGSRSCEKPPTELEAGIAGGFSLVSELPSARQADPAEILGLMVLVTVMAAGAFLPSSAAFLGAVAVFGAILAGVVVRDAFGTQELLVDVNRKAVDRRLRLAGRTVTRQKDWLDLSRVAELHLHREVALGKGVPGLVRFRIDALMADGTLRTVYLKTAMVGADHPEQHRAVAERLAAAADCIVRSFEDGVIPTKDELVEAAAQRRAELAAAEEQALVGDAADAPLQLPESPPEP